MGAMDRLTATGHVLGTLVQTMAGIVLVFAAAVAVGTESFRDPAAGRRVASELADLGERRAAHRCFPARAEGFPDHRQARRIQLHLRAAPEHEGGNRGQMSEVK